MILASIETNVSNKCYFSIYNVYVRYIELIQQINEHNYKHFFTTTNTFVILNELNKLMNIANKHSFIITKIIRYNEYLTKISNLFVVMKLLTNTRHNEQFTS